MSRAVANKLYRDFTKGLITEASPLTFPENASFDEDNCILFRKGNRTRRLGIDYEQGAALSNYTTDRTITATYAFKEFIWEAAAQISNLNFLVNQIGPRLYFYDLNNDPVSSGLKNFTVDLSSFQVNGTSGFEQLEVQMSSGKGYLFVVGAKIEPFYVSYNTTTDSITTTRIYIQRRDFLGLDDGLANDEEPTGLSTNHYYNLRNQGWVDPNNPGTGINNVSFFSAFGSLLQYTAPASGPIQQYFTKFNRYPGNNKQWWVAKATSDHDSLTVGDFDPALLNKFYFGTGRAPRGHFVVDAFNVDRSAVSGVPNIPVESSIERPVTTAFFAGRVWYGLNDTIYFSQVLDDKRKAGFCYQEADPTAETISDLVATDGGVIPIPEMTKVVRLFPVGAGVLVFANNGIWYISGTTSGFSALDFSVSKVSAIGIDSPNSIVAVDFQIYYWSKVGVHAMSPRMGTFGPVEGQFDKTLISESTIQTFYNDKINDSSKQFVKGQYDPATNVIQWLFKTDNTPGNYFFDRVLNLDLTLQAFYPWTISSTSDTPYVNGFFLTPKLNSVVTTENVTVGGALVTVGSAPVTVSHNFTEVRKNFVKFLIAVPNINKYNYTFGLFNNSNYADWQRFDNVGRAYTSYLETGYELMDDAMRDKQANFVFCYFNRTEDEWLVTADGVTLAHPSSCYFQARWNWASSEVSNRWTTKIQAYRLSRFMLYDGTNTNFDNGFATVMTKNKIRGHGKSLQFRFENSEIGSTFDLLGWAVEYTGNTAP